MGNSGSNNDTSIGIDLLTQIAYNFGASYDSVKEALNNPIGSNTDSRKVIGLLMLLAHMSSGTSINPTTEE